jgi:hypothetical protein
MRNDGEGGERRPLADAVDRGCSGGRSPAPSASSDGSLSAPVAMHAGFTDTTRTVVCGLRWSPTARETSSERVEQKIQFIATLAGGRRRLM